MQDKSCVFSKVSNMVIQIPIMFKTESSTFLMWHYDLHCYIWWQYTYKDVLDRQCYELVIRKIHIKIWHSQIAWEQLCYTHNINQVQYKDKGSTLTCVLKHTFFPKQKQEFLWNIHTFLNKQHRCSKWGSISSLSDSANFQWFYVQNHITCWDRVGMWRKKKRERKERLEL
jgi:hypothetical protein